MLPSFLTNLVLSTARIWSNKIKPVLFLKVQETRQGKSKPLVVIGAIKTVDKADISLGEITTQGRVLLISLPLVGFRSTSQTSNLFTTPNPRPLLMERPAIHRRLILDLLLPMFVQLLVPSLGVVDYQ